MPASSQNNLNGQENVPLKHVPGTGVEQPEVSEAIPINEDCTTSCCNDKYHRKLAIAGIICGFSCCGVPALVYSVKAEDAEKGLCQQTTDTKSATYLKKAKKWGIISILTWVFLLVSAPMLLALFSYLITLSD